MKATTALVALVLMGLIMSYNGYETIGTKILDKILPSDLGGDGSTSWAGLVVVGAGALLSFGVLLLGQRLPYAALATLIISLILLPVDVITAPGVNMPYPIKITMGIVYLGLMVSAAVGIFKGDA